MKHIIIVLITVAVFVIIPFNVSAEMLWVGFEGDAPPAHETATVEWITLQTRSGDTVKALYGTPVSLASIQR